LDWSQTPTKKASRVPPPEKLQGIIGKKGKVQKKRSTKKGVDPIGLGGKGKIAPLKPDSPGLDGVR